MFFPYHFSVLLAFSNVAFKKLLFILLAFKLTLEKTFVCFTSLVNRRNVSRVNRGLDCKVQVLCLVEVKAIDVVFYKSFELISQSVLEQHLVLEISISGIDSIEVLLQ